ncbi:unnamed protein product, partial [Rotaria sordida]
ILSCSWEYQNNAFPINVSEIKSFRSRIISCNASNFPIISSNQSATSLWPSHFWIEHSCY